MSTADEERAFWDDKAITLEGAKESIAASPEAWNGEVLEKCLDLILPALDAAPHREGRGPRVLDLGCGAGRLTIPIKRLRPQFALTGLDVSEAMLTHAAVAEEPGHPIRWLLGDGRTLPGNLGRIDAAYSMITFQHIPRIAQANYIHEVAHALVRRGVFRFQVLEGESEVFLGHHVTPLWIYETCEAAGFNVQAIDGMRPFASRESAPNALWVTAVKK